MDQFIIIGLKLFCMLPTLIGLMACMFTLLGAYVFKGGL